MNWLPAATPVPALIVRPRGAVSLDEAHLAIEQWEHYSGKRLDPAQRVAVELMMAEAADGRWAALTTGRSVSRQNGKGDEIEVVEAWGLTRRGEAIAHTAHEIPTAKSAHERLVAHLEGHRDLRRLIRGSPTYGNGNQTIPMTNDGIITYRTRTGGGLRGLDDISRLVVDEAQHAQPEQLASATPILAANPNPQTNFIGTAAILGRSDWWWTIRKRALDGDDDGFSYLEHSAEHVELNQDGRVVSTPPNPEDRDAWRRANPAYGVRLEERFLREQFRTLGPQLFAREHLGVWDPHNDGEGGVVPYGEWLNLGDPDSRIASKICLGLWVSADGAWSSFATVGRRPDGHLHFDTNDRRPGTAWVVARAAELHRRHGVPIHVQPGSPAGALIKSLTEARVKVAEVGEREYAQACVAVLEAVKNGGLRHLGQESMNRSVASAGRRDFGKEGLWVWAYMGAADISPLQAASVALCGVAANAPSLFVAIT